MSTNPEGFLVVLEEFARSHYCKDLSKRASWNTTWKGLELTLARFDANALSGKLEPPLKINGERNLFLYKMSFRLADENKSAKASGHRMVFACDYKNRIIRILVVYNKNHVKGNHETDWFMGLLNEQYKDVMDRFTTG